MDHAPSETRPWQSLGEALEAGSSYELREYLDSLDPVATVRAVSRLSDEQRSRLLEAVEPQEAAGLLEQIPESQAVDALAGITPQSAAEILEELPSNEQADLISELDEPEAVLSEMDPARAVQVRELVSYPEGTAGSLMLLECLSYPEDWTVQESLLDLNRNAETYADYDIQYAYVRDDDARLVGVLRMRDLLLAPRWKTLGEIMIADPLAVEVGDDVHALEGFFDEHDWFGAPVISENGVLLGVVRRSDVEEALTEESEEVFRRSQGIIGGEELRDMPLLRRSSRRLAWLSVNVVLNVAAASVIALHQDTLQAVIALAVFLPIISDMSGCSGNQAVAVSIRELSLGVLEPREHLRVLGKEILVGAINGASLGLLLGTVAWLWKGNAWLGLVVGGALTLNTMLAVCVGGVVPLFLKRFGKDPALASGPILTTVTDSCGFVLVLSLASMVLGRLS